MAAEDLRLILLLLQKVSYQSPPTTTYNTCFPLRTKQQRALVGYQQTALWDFIKPHPSSLPSLSASACLLQRFKGDRPSPALLKSQPVSLSLSSYDSLSLAFTSCLSSVALLLVLVGILNRFPLYLSKAFCPLSPASLLLPSLKPQAWPGPMASLGGTHPAAWLARGQRDAPILGQREAGQHD